MQSKLVFTSNAISLYFFFFFLIVDLYFLILATFRKIFNPVVELSIPLESSTKEVKAEKEIHTVTAKTKVRVRKCSM